MTSKSIDLSEEIYNQLLSMKSEDESWDEFIIRLTKAVKYLNPSNDEWTEAYEKTFTENNSVFQKLSK